MTSRASAGTPRYLPLLLAFVLLSGGCALVYQVLWLRLLALTFGVTVHAAATVLGSFMGGLALGSLLSGRLADRTTRPLRLFGFVELAIAGCGLISPFALGAVQDGFIALSPQLPDSIAVGTAIRVVCSIAILLVPTALMGATMPVIVKAAVAHSEALGVRVSLLYAANTTGAIAGTLGAGFYLIPALGLSRSFLVAASVNAIVGLTALAMSRAMEGTAARPVTGPTAAQIDVPQSTPDAGAKAALLVAGISGFASLALEVVWFRLLAIFQGPTSYTFTIVLAVVLTGIAAGSAIAAPLLRWRRLDWVQGLALLQLLGVALVLQSLSGIILPGDVPAWLQRLLSNAGAGFASPSVAMSLAVVLPTSLFFGASFPIALRIWARDSDGMSHAGRRIGAFYAVNVGGGILGSLFAGFLLLPLIGSRGSVLILAALYLVGACVLQAAAARRQPFMTGLFIAGVAAVAIIASATPNPLDIMSRRIYTGRPVLWQSEGTQTTVAVAGDAESRVLFLDGRHQANDSAAMSFIHRRIGLLPVILHPDPKRALVVGLGGGASPGAMSQFPGLSVDVVELSDGVIAAADYFSHINFDILRNPSVHLRVDDGRNFLQRVRTPYDVVTADAIIPRHAGANSLNSVEYFELVRRALTPNGIALHWNGGANDAEFRLILSAFQAVFPQTTLWGDGALMVGSRLPLTVSRARIDALLARPDTRKALALMHISDVDDLERMLRAGPEDARDYAQGSGRLSDDRPLLEYYESLPQTEKDLSRLLKRVEGIIVR